MLRGLFSANKDVDARHKAGHGDLGDHAMNAPQGSFRPSEPDLIRPILLSTRRSTRRGAAYRIPPIDPYIPAMGKSLLPASLLLVLLGCAPQQVAGYELVQAYPVAPAYPATQGVPVTQAYPQERGVVCAVKYGMRQNYWNAGLAQADGATVIFLGECPAEPNSEGLAH
jgi:hypothetical protein